MVPSRVHAVIAAGLANPALIARWREQPERLAALGVDPGAFDLQALEKFAGLALKIRHNGLRGDLPWTFRLLEVAGLEIEVFVAYASSRASTGALLGDTDEARTCNLLAFLEGWLDPTRRDHALLWDLIRHESTIARLARVTMSAVPAVNRSAKPQATGVPRRRDELVLHEMRSDPRAVVMLLREKSPPLGDAVLGTFHFAYARTSVAAEIDILQLDEAGFYLLSLVDGRRTLAEISEQLGAGRRPPRAFVRACEALGSAGVLTFERGRGRRS